MNDLARFVFNSPFNLGRHLEPRKNEGGFIKEFHRNGKGCWIPKTWIQEPTITMKNKHNPSEEKSMGIFSKVADEFTEISILT